MAKSSKGSVWERKFCKKLSMWWSNEERDDLFWRTSQSGGRATSRTKKGKRTYGQYGDINSTDPISKPFTDLFTVELKRGYNAHTPYDLIDRGLMAAPKQWEQWIEKIIQTSLNANTPAWMIVHRRDRREPIICIPDIVKDVGSATPEMTIDYRHLKKYKNDPTHIHFYTLDRWLCATDSSEILSFLEELS